jgi:hypothetical protein
MRWIRSGLKISRWAYEVALPRRMSIRFLIEQRRIDAYQMLTTNKEALLEAVCAEIGSLSVNEAVL